MRQKTNWSQIYADFSKEFYKFIKRNIQPVKHFFCSEMQKK